MYVAGLDIGYSNTKFAAGDASDKPLIMASIPSGAGKLSSMPDGIMKNSATVRQVLINGEAWAAGVEQGRLQNLNRGLHHDFINTDGYKALFYAALLDIGRTNIDHIVTGLPVSHYKDKKIRQQLIQTMSGTHHIADKVYVTVHEVSVTRQPNGAFMNLLMTFDDLDLIENGRILIIDPGYFSVDWVLVDRCEIKTESSNTSLKAVSVLLEAIQSLIKKQVDGVIPVENLEHALREGKSFVYLYGEKINIQPFIDQSMRDISISIIESVRQSMRHDDHAPDLVMIAGGGARYYEQCARMMFPRSKIFIPEQPLLSNAIGFWYSVANH